jgi:hypothetical protein
MQKNTAFAALLLFMSACSADQPARLKPDFTTATPPLNLDVQNIEVADRSGMQPADSPYNAHNFQPTIAEAIRHLAHDKLHAVGRAGSGQAIVIIKDAVLTVQPLPHNNDIFTRQQGSKYTAHAAVEIEAQGNARYALASAEATRFETLPENPSETERQNAYYTVLNGLMRDLDHNIQTSLQDHVQAFIITAPILDNGGAAGMPSSYAAP